jgi:formylmethanofuran dehydrogenase subunit E
MRMTGILFVTAFIGFAASDACAHELWMHLGPDAGVVRLTIGDTPNVSEAERVGEIAHANLWADGKPLEVKRLPDGLEAQITGQRPVVVSAFADRGVVTFRGDSVVIHLTAYGQTRAIGADQAAKLGLDDDQLRFLLVSREDGPPVVQAQWKGKPAADAVVKIFHGSENPSEAHTDAHGQIPCPDLREGPWFLFAQVIEKTPGKRDGRDYSEIRYEATLAISPEAAFGPAVAACLARVKEVHGAAGPWVVAGYRIGERALKELGLARQSHNLDVVHRCPLQVQYSCMADGLMAATGASPGKLNLHLEEATVDGLKTVVRNRERSRSLVFTLKPEFVRSISDLPMDRLEAEGRRVASLPDEEIFSVSDSARPGDNRQR